MRQNIAIARESPAEGGKRTSLGADVPFDGRYDGKRVQQPCLVASLFL